MAKAHLILFVDTTAYATKKTDWGEGEFARPTIVGAGIFGSENITSDLKRRYPIPFLFAEADTFAEASEQLEQIILQPHLNWVNLLR